jgi:hypothetical protein
MLTPKFSVKPGDLIKWINEATDQHISVDEELWSTPLCRYVPIGSKFVHMLMAIDNDHITWFNSRGIFYAHVDDTVCGGLLQRNIVIIPRACR